MEPLFKKYAGRSSKLAKTIIGLIIAVVLIFLGFIFYRSDIESYYIAAFLWIITVLVLLWSGNKYLFTLLGRWFSWSGDTSKRFFVQLFFSTVYSLLCINLTYYLFKVQTSSAPDLEQILVLNIYGLLFIIPVLSINFGLYFMNQWKKAHLQSDKLREENLKTQLESLKMQLDPHFLFNNLNVLSSLIELDPKTAQDILDKFADVYRYVLRYKKEELVSLNTELEFIRSYVFLLKKRFGDQLIVDIAINADLSDILCIPPLTLQLLVENAIKHNKISDASPLHIQIYLENDAVIVVKNNVQLKEAKITGLAQTGLENIRKRYEYLSDAKVEIEEGQHNFVVRLPLLEMY